MSLHTNNKYAKKRGIRKKLPLTTRAATLDEQLDLVAVDFNGAAWRRTTNANNVRIIEDCDFADASWPHLPLWGPGAVPGTWSDVCGFLKPLDSSERWTVRQHGAFPILHEALGICPTDQSCHLEVWLHMEKNAQRRTIAANKRVKAGEDASDHSLFSVEQGDYSQPIQARCYHTACEQNADLHRCATISVHQGHQRLT